MQVPEEYKGIPSLYDKVLDIFSDDEKKVSFYDWITPGTTTLCEGQVCYSVVHYFKRKRWFLAEHNYCPENENNSTWFAHELTSRLPDKEPSGLVKKYFDLQKDEALTTVHCKLRPVVLLKKNLNNWWNPTSMTGVVESWTCVPIFSYKERHLQSYVLEDQRLNTSRFYIPPIHEGKPGIEKESAVCFDAIQTILTGNIKPLRAYSLEKSMSIPFKLSEYSLKMLSYHKVQVQNNMRCFQEIQTEYEIFKSMVNELIDGALK